MPEAEEDVDCETTPNREDLRKLREFLRELANTPRYENFDHVLFGP